MASVRKQPERTCIGCRQSKPQSQLVRYVVAPDQSLLVDYRHRLPGRGAYTCINSDCIEKAIVRKQFQRCFRNMISELSVEQMCTELRKAITQRIKNLVGMARKSGQLTSGSNAVISALKQPLTIAVILITKDISMGIAKKIIEISDRNELPSYQLFTKESLGQLLGKEERSVIAVHASTLADALLVELQRFAQMAREN